MTLDITCLVTDAEHRRLFWSQSRAENMARRISALLSGQLDWDEGAGENWARVAIDSSIVCAINTLIPIALVKMRPDCGISGILRSEEIVTIEFADWDEPQFSASKSTILATFDRQAWPDSINEKAFSPSDLWWMTV